MRLLSRCISSQPIYRCQRISALDTWKFCRSTHILQYRKDCLKCRQQRSHHTGSRLYCPSEGRRAWGLFLVLQKSLVSVQGWNPQSRFLKGHRGWLLVFSNYQNVNVTCFQWPYNEFLTTFCLFNDANRCLYLSRASLRLLISLRGQYRANTAKRKLVRTLSMAYSTLFVW